MDFIKKHYEKVILSVVLLGLAVAAASLPVQVSRVRDYLDQTVRGVVRTKPKVFLPLDLSTNIAMMERRSHPIKLELSGHHNLFNPVPWKKMPDGRLTKLQTGNEIGPGALRIDAIKELNLQVSLDDVGGPPDNPRYRITILDETARVPRPATRTASVGTKNDLFEIFKADGPPENPVVMLQLKEDKEPITITKDQPHVRVKGYAADLNYPPEKLLFPGRRARDLVKLVLEVGESETYKIVAITPSEVVLSANSTQKRTTIKLNATP